MISLDGFIFWRESFRDNGLVTVVKMHACNFFTGAYFFAGEIIVLIFVDILGAV